VRRDVVLLESLRTALDLLASDLYSAAFGSSTDQDDYRWGLVHRVKLNHPLGGSWSIPPAAGFEDQSPELLGISREGGCRTVNLEGSTTDPRAQGADAFVFSIGSSPRLIFAIGEARARPDGVLGFANVAGGASGDPSSPTYASQLATWLTSDHHKVPMNSRDVRDIAERAELFVPAP
jgi:penicillin amidase